MEPVAPPALELIASIEASLGPAVDLGEGAAGRRRIVPILGGRIEGKAFGGTVLPGGNDVQLIRGDGVAEIAARYGIALDGGGSLFVENKGVRHGPPEALAALARGERIDPSLIYFRTQLRFSTDRPELSWLERDLFVGAGMRLPESVRIDAYRVS
jgi:uncharacterized protein DUF3237